MPQVRYTFAFVFYIVINKWHAFVIVSIYLCSVCNQESWLSFYIVMNGLVILFHNMVMWWLSYISEDGSTIWLFYCSVGCLLAFFVNNAVVVVYRCYARLHPRAVNCRKKKCGHSNQVHRQVLFIELCMNCSYFNILGNKGV